MKKLHLHADESSISLNAESKDRFSTGQRFVIILAAIVAVAFVLAVRVEPIPVLIFFGCVALLVVILVLTLDSRDKDEKRWDKMYR